MKRAERFNKKKGRPGSVRLESITEDSRKARRTRALIVGNISFAGSSISCTVSGLTESGATLDVLISPLGVPRIFTLLIPSDRARHECRILWVKDRRMGVSFLLDMES